MKRELVRRGLVVFLFLVFAGSLYMTKTKGVTASYYGTVTDADTEEVLQGASVVLYVYYQGDPDPYIADTDTTDSNGNYTVSYNKGSNVEATYLHFSKSGYQSEYHEVDTGGQRKDVDLNPV
ncbi:MAG: hypothetical protein GF308_22155 [Candidatus Heimdallarchaeota archaeon]|nr:hypothetical protein [Candidatus Heimdallarchaeota archaeon]